jgi:stringent starvation protein B
VTEFKATSRRPYLLRALHEWMTDNRLTPHVVVDADVEGVVVPKPFVKDGKIILNIDYEATAQLHLGNDVVQFSARFSGAPFEIYLPINAIMGIYARETGQGMIFEDIDPTDPVPPEPESGPSAEPTHKRPQLKVVK